MSLIANYTRQLIIITDEYVIWRVGFSNSACDCLVLDLTHIGTDEENLMRTSLFYAGSSTLFVGVELTYLWFCTWPTRPPTSGLAIIGPIMPHSQG
jgi:hypothetical protein